MFTLTPDLMTKTRVEPSTAPTRPPSRMGLPSRFVRSPTMTRLAIDDRPAVADAPHDEGATGLGGIDGLLEARVNTRPLPIS